MSAIAVLRRVQPSREDGAALGVYLASRLAVLGAFLITGVIDPNMSLYRAFLRWDSGWFSSLIQDGYPNQIPMAGDKVGQSTIAFFPGYPDLARVVGKTFGLSNVGGAALTSFVLGIVTTLVLRRLVAHVRDDETALRAVALFWFFPGSMVLSMAYSEALMIPASIICVHALMKRRWLLAGLAGFVATASRSTAIALMACCVWSAAVALWKRREWRSLLAPVLTPLGMLSYFLYLHFHTGDWRAWFRTESDAWAERFDFGARTAHRAAMAFHHPSASAYNTVTTIGLLFALVSIVLLLRQRTKSELLLYALGVAVFTGASRTIGFRPRFLLSSFPFVIALAVWAKGWRFSALVGTFATLLGGLTILMCTSLVLAP